MSIYISNPVSIICRCLFLILYFWYYISITDNLLHVLGFFTMQKSCLYCVEVKQASGWLDEDLRKILPFPIAQICPQTRLSSCCSSARRQHVLCATVQQCTVNQDKKTCFGDRKMFMSKPETTTKLHSSILWGSYYKMNTANIYWNMVCSTNPTKKHFVMHLCLATW